MSIAEIDPAAGHDLVCGGAVLLDVRELDEWTAGHAPAATWIALGELQAQAAQVPADRTIVCICRSGARSLRAAEFLVARGHDARNLAGGMRAWAAAGLSVVTEAGEAGTVI